MEGTQVHVDWGIDASISLPSGVNSPHDLAHSPRWRRLRFEYSLRDTPCLSSISRGRPVSICIRGVYYRPPHLFEGGYWCFRNLWGIFGPFGYESPRVLRRRLELGRGGSRAVRAGVQRINAQAIKRLVGTLLKFAV